MANTIRRNKVSIEGNKMLADVVKTLGIPEGNIKSYDHCQTQEEIEMELYGELLQEGKSHEVAEELAKEIAHDLWANR